MTGTMRTFSLLCCLALFYLPPFPVCAQSADAFRAPESSASMLETPRTAGQSADIHDIFGPLPLDAPPPYRLYGVLALLLAATAGTALFLLFRARNRRTETPGPDPTAQARAALQAARAAHHETGDLRRYCEDVSVLLRRYVEETTGYRISSRTTLETQQELGSSVAPQVFSNNDVIEGLHRCLEYCDMVKFSRYQPGGEDTERIGQLAASFISGSRTIREEK